MMMNANIYGSVVYRLHYSNERDYTLWKAHTYTADCRAHFLETGKHNKAINKVYPPPPTHKQARRYIFIVSSVISVINLIAKC